MNRFPDFMHMDLSKLTCGSASWPLAHYVLS
jgi:hypothetical protein